jgi:Uroporphyrinogen decarboxylase (URO-D)
MKDLFDTSLADAQGSSVEALTVQSFDIERYADYESSLLDGCSTFRDGNGGVAVYRRFRVPEVFSWACADRKLSLELQLAALNKSMVFKADIPNFLEPWYGIGVVSSAFGVPYLWKEGQAPAVEGPFQNARDALDHKICSIADSVEGNKVLEMIEYFIDQTKGKIPVSLGDTQSPLNVVSSYLMDSTAFMYELYDHPDDLKSLLLEVAQMENEFIEKQRNLIGDALVRPGHGFASSRRFEGLGFSDDNILMFGDEVYSDFAVNPMMNAAADFKGPVFHSCGNWAERSNLVKSIPGLLMADGAVGNQTDPSPNDPEILGRAFAGSGIILHCRIVGSSDIVLENFKRLWRKGLKCIVTTYCSDPEDQLKAYEGIHQVVTDKF